MIQPLTRVAGYIRLSDPKKQEKGYSKQFQEGKIRQRCSDEGWSIKPEHIFYDGFRGVYWREREGLQAMLSSARRHEFDILLLYDLDRLAREPVHQAIILEELTYLGIQVIILDPEKKRVADGTFEGDALAAFDGLVAKEEHRKRIRRTHDGVEERIVKEKKIMPSHKPLYGYKWDDDRPKQKNKYVIFEPEAQVVRKIFNWKLHGLTIQRICITLNSEGIPTPGGGTVWKPQVVLDILRHPSYKGKAYALRHKYSFSPTNGKMTRIMRPQEEWIELPEGTIPGIVSEYDWDEVQRQLQRNKEQAARRNSHPEAALCRAGVAKCGVCGSNMSYKKKYSAKHGGCDHYRCIRQSQIGNTCTNSVMSVKVVDDLVWGKVLELVAHPRLIEIALRKKYHGENPNEQSLQNLDRLILKAGAKIQNLMESLEDETDREMRKLLSLRIRDLNEEKAKYEEERDTLCRLTLQWEEAVMALERFKEWCLTIHARIENGEEISYYEKRNAVDKLGVKIICYPITHHPRHILTCEPPEIIECLGVPQYQASHAHVNQDAKDIYLGV